VGGGDDQVGVDDLVVLVDAVVVDQRAARRLDDADAAQSALAAHDEVAAGEVVVEQQLLDALGRMQHLDHARPVVAERRRQRRAAVEGLEGDAFCLGQFGRDEVALRHPRQRADAVPAGLAALLHEEGKLHVRPGLHFLVDQFVVTLVVGMVEDRAAPGVGGAQAAVVEVERAVGAHQASRFESKRPKDA
jgi:hypothetical protein